MRPRAGRHPGRRGVGQDHHHHAPHRTPDRHRYPPAGADPRRHVHRQGCEGDGFEAGLARLPRRAGQDLPCGGPGPAPGAVRHRPRDHAVEDADPPATDPVAADAAPLCRRAKRCVRDRVGAQPPCRPGGVPGRHGRPCPSHPRRSHGRPLRVLRAPQARAQPDGLRGPAGAHARPDRGQRRCRRQGPSPVRGLLGRRVPGRQPPAAEPVGCLGWGPAGPLRRRRRLPVDLRVHRGHAALPRRLPHPVSGVPRREPAGQLPFVAGGTGHRQPARGGPRRPASPPRGGGREARPAPDPAQLRLGRRRGGMDHRRGKAPARRGHPVGGDGRPLPHQWALGAAGTGTGPCPDPLPGGHCLPPPPGRPCGPLGAAARDGQRR